ncbi:hypothetical protein I8751_13360 [Nostocaceae cyanobacterium CENA357]|uniref:Uncharacterized protein n=1 Tax=Atlanticothrix silvestris CENA357 TaxID=1725252 RepID=A0A8J7L2N4_9CYAN|nr:hypothetical protein [Atlanticothrix silvestris]MBH8553344.1 hypothetical protein [Atlanticothrix silvestris CENA357]
MRQPETIFVIPTCRLRDVAQTIEEYDKNFWANGHATKIIVFDDSSVSNHEKYYPLLEQTKTFNDIFYVGPREKEQFISFLNERLRDRKLESLVKNLFRPSYGGNRNFTLMYTLGHLMVSADDDMRPDALIETSRESLSEDEICRGRLIKPHEQCFIHKSFDILTAFEDVLGQDINHIPKNFEIGELIIDTAMDLETNTTKGYFHENSLFLQKGKLANECVVKIAQTFRTGTNDIDTLDFVHIYLNNENQINPDDLNNFYILTNFRPVITNKNWRMDCGVAGYDNRLGLPPFFPTRLRFEDYIYRLWIQQEGIVAAHVDAVQNHTRNNYMRNPLASEIFNEEICNLLKRRIKDSVYHLDDMGIKFDYYGEVTLQESEEILEKISTIHTQIIKASESTKNQERKYSLQLFSDNLSRVFYGFEADFFQQNVSRIVDDVISQFHASLEIWPTLVEICYLQKDKKNLPQILVKNKKLKA